MVKLSWPISGCQDNFFQNGDLDFDGSSYIRDWPDGSPNHPTSFAYTGPVSHGKSYPQIQFETDVAGSEAACDVTTGAGCTAPPTGAQFYPFWTLGHGGRTGCLWNFGDVIWGQTLTDFGGDAQYGTPDVARYGGTLTSPVLANPQISEVADPAVRPGGGPALAAEPPGRVRRPGGLSTFPGLTGACAGGRSRSGGRAAARRTGPA